MKLVIELNTNSFPHLGDAIGHTIEMIQWIMDNLPAGANLNEYMDRVSERRGPDDRSILLESIPDDEPTPTETNCRARIYVDRADFDVACRVIAQAEKGNGEIMAFRGDERVAIKDGVVTKETQA